MLYWVSTIINFVFLIAAVWLGIYIVSRSPRNPVAWLTGLTLWSVASMFLNMLLAFNPPPVPVELPPWVPLLFPFWPAGTTSSGWSGWLQGWLVIPAIVFWHHVTVLLRPEKMNPWRWTRVMLGYAAALTAVLIHLNTDLLFSSVSGDPLYLNTLKPGPLYPAFLVLLLLFTIMSLVNLQRSTLSATALMQKKQLKNLTIATLIAGLTGPVALITAIFALPLPRIILSILLGTAVILLGVGVTRYSALMEGRTIRRDFLFNAIALGVITCIYLLVTWISTQLFEVPLEVYILVVLLAIVTHSLIDISGQALDTIIYGKNRQIFRSNINKLSRSIGEKDLAENLAQILDTMCTSVRATYGLIVLFEEYSLRQIAACQWRRSKLPVSIGDLTSDDVQHLEPEHFPSPLDTAALLMPLYSKAEQIGVIIFGRPVNGINYLPADVDLLLYPSDKVADVIQNTRREEKFISELSDLASSQQSTSAAPSNSISVQVVEDALRNLFDFAHLGDTPLIELNLVRRHLPSSDVTHIDQGKAVHNILSATVEKLRPSDDLPGEPVPREWYPYRILHGAYMEDMLNRDIMSQLYISEGTFNRTRRAAIRSVTRMLQEMEAASN
jgi:GAF domain-containing protein